jgi:hypothetical protein
MYRDAQVHVLQGRRSRAYVEGKENSLANGHALKTNVAHDSVTRISHGGGKLGIHRDGTSVKPFEVEGKLCSIEGIRGDACISTEWLLLCREAVVIQGQVPDIDSEDYRPKDGSNDD